MRSAASDSTRPVGKWRSASSVRTSRVASVHTFEGRLDAWREEQPDSWVFVTLPPELSDEIDARLTSPPRGFGSVRVSVRCGTSEWSTSLFPSKEAGSYVLPVKKPVRRKEELEPGDTARFTLTVLD
jgi:Domain of unknown function (DUF1905)